MGTLVRSCPHCQSTNSTFTAFGQFKDPTIFSEKRYLCAFECGNCHAGMFAVVVHYVGDEPVRYNGNIGESENFKLLSEYPKDDGISAPDHVPNNIGSFYVQAVHGFKSRNYDSSAMMARKVLEVSVKKLEPNGSGSLFNRIEQLFSAGKITADLKEWAHIIREDGNQAAHEELPVSQEFSEELLAFTELFLMYTFTMPGMVANKKKIKP